MIHLPPDSVKRGKTLFAGILSMDFEKRRLHSASRPARYGKRGGRAEMTPDVRRRTGAAPFAQRRSLAVL